MIREVRLLGKGGELIAGNNNAIDPGTSGYPWANTPSMTLSEVWNDELTSTYAYRWGGAGDGHAMLFEPGPTLSLFTKVTFECDFDYSQTGPNNWYFPPDNAYGPRCTIWMRNRAKDDYIEGTGAATFTFGEAICASPCPNAGNVSWPYHNTNRSTHPTQYLGHPLIWELTSHPEGGVWSLEDINNLAAGVYTDVSNGSNGKPYDPSQGSFFKVRIAYFKCTLTVQDLGGYVRSVRHNSSATERMHRKARNTVSITVPAHVATKEIGEEVHIAHRRGPDGSGDGWGEKALERRSIWLAQRTYWPEALKIVDEGYDLHDFSCEMWAALRIPIAWSPELSGFAYLDQGGEWTLARAQDAWSLRPGDGVALRVLEDYLNLSEEGLALHSANGTELALYNQDPGLTGWSTTDASGGTVTYTEETSSVIADELGYQTARLMEFPGTPGTSGKKREFTLGASDTVSVRARVRSISVSEPETKFLEVALLAPDGKFWNETNRAWEVGAYYKPIPASAAFGEVVMDQIPNNGAGTYTVKLGRFSSAINSCSFVIGLVNVVKNDHGMGMPLVTLADEIVRAADVWTLDNVSPKTFWHRDRGMGIFEFRPFWRAALLTAATQKRIVLATHAASAWDEVRFVAGSTDQFVFERYDTEGGSRTVAVDIVDANGDPLHMTRANYARVFVRWLDAAGWRDRPPYEAMVGYAIYNTADESFVSYHEETAIWVAPSSAVEDEVSLSGLDGWVRWVEVKHNPMTGQEAVWRR